MKIIYTPVKTDADGWIMVENGKTGNPAGMLPSDVFYIGPDPAAPPPVPLFRRQARVRIDMDYAVRRGNVEMKALAEAFMGVLVLDVEHRISTRHSTYTVCGERFDPVDDGSEPPMYKLICTRHELGRPVNGHDYAVTVEWQKA